MSSAMAVIKNCGIAIEELVSRKILSHLPDAIHSEVTDKDIDFLVQPWLSNSGKKVFYRQIAQMDQKHTDEIEVFF
jgi:hypothetical protein